LKCSANEIYALLSKELRELKGSGRLSMSLLGGKVLACKAHKQDNKFYWRESLAHKGFGLEFGPRHSDRDCILLETELCRGSTFIYVLHSPPDSYPSPKGAHPELYSADSKQAKCWRIAEVTAVGESSCRAQIIHCLDYGEKSSQRKKVSDRMARLPDAWLKNLMALSAMDAGRRAIGSAGSSLPSSPFKAPQGGSTPRAGEGAPTAAQGGDGAAAAAQTGRGGPGESPRAEGEHAGGAAADTTHDSSALNTTMESEDSARDAAGAAAEDVKVDVLSELKSGAADGAASGVSADPEAELKSGAANGAEGAPADPEAELKSGSAVADGKAAPEAEPKAELKSGSAVADGKAAAEPETEGEPRGEEEADGQGAEAQAAVEGGVNADGHPKAGDQADGAGSEADTEADRGVALSAEQRSLIQILCPCCCV